MATTKPRKNLNKHQQEILNILYKFRFGTVELIAEYMELESSKYTYTRLKILLDKKLIARRYTGKDKIQGKQASYYLLKKSLKTLKENPDINTKALNNVYKDSVVGEKFIDNCLEIFKIYNKFVSLFGKKVDYYTKSELTGDESFAKPLPDGYIEIGTSTGSKPFFLIIINNSIPFFVVRRIIEHYIKHFESGEWEDTDIYPTLLFICENMLIERRVRRLANRLLENAYVDDMSMFVTSRDKFLKAKDHLDKIWTNVVDRDEIVHL